MTTLVDLRLAATDTVLGRTFEAIPDLECEVERVIAAADRCLWVGGAERSRIESALSEDPSVAQFESIADGDGRWLYDVEFATDRAEAVDPLALISEADGTVLTASAADGSWSLRARFVDREDVRRVYDRFDEHEVETTVVRLQDLSESVGSDRGLTPQQHETLVAAIDHGYFAIPREVSMQELADELDISHQALSERFRRAYRTLVAAELNVPAESPSTNRVEGD